MGTRRPNYASPPPPARSAIRTTSFMAAADLSQAVSKYYEGVPQHAASGIASDLIARSEYLSPAVQVDEHVKKKLRLEPEHVETAMSDVEAGSPHRDTSPAPINPDLRLMGIAPELRQEIFRHILVKDSPIFATFSRGPYNIYTWSDGRVLGYDEHSRKVGPRNTTSILRVCKQARYEGRGILYGENEFITHYFTVFMESFIGDCTAGIQTINAKLIRKARFEVPMSVKQIQSNVGAFVWKISGNLSGLQELTLTTEDDKTWKAKQDDSFAFQIEQIKEMCLKQRRGLLHAAAWVTQSHPRLKKAIWKAKNGGSIVPRSSGAALKYLLKYEILLVSQRRDEWLQIKASSLDECGKPRDAKSIVLDCQKIRNTLWDYLRDATESDFALSDSATSSEVSMLGCQAL
ncbi:hypothetical protein H2200_012329 [Cladophialophora chaetospira]|uniref:Uncharacterized protein n=1 Tax=Cladophialophora chaetospira TaxID=386627 RepID=A0AA39CCA7_9EURO|nr:hypothetical protein H2200_012329 [Cladophialophora chaetospira]